MSDGWYVGALGAATRRHWEQCHRRGGGQEQVLRRDRAVMCRRRRRHHRVVRVMQQPLLERAPRQHGAQRMLLRRL